MEVEFENLLCKARRGEEVFYSFSEAREKFFSSVGDATLYNALEYLGVETLACNEEERIFFQKQLPHQTGPVRLIGEQSLLRLRRHLLYPMQFQRNFPPLGYHFPFSPSNYGFMGNFPFTPLPGQFRLGKERDENYSTGCANNESGPSFSTGQSCRQSEPVLFSELSEIPSGRVHCKYGQEKNRNCSTRFPNNESACATKPATDKSDVRQVISSDLEDNRSGQIQCRFEAENTAEHSPSRFWSEDRASPPKPATSEGRVPSIQCVEVESRSSQVEKDETPSHGQERSVLIEKDASNEAASCDEKRQPATLSDEELSPNLRSEFSELREFYSQELNIDRGGSALQSSTVEKMVERVSRYLWFLKYVKNIAPVELFHCANPELVQEFVRFMIDRRGVKAVTCSRYISAFINVSKVPLNSLKNRGQLEVCESIEKIRGIQRQLEGIAKRQRVNASANKPQAERKVVYAELLELCRELKWEFTEATGPAKARTCMNLCLLLLYCSANPGRAKEYITLRLYKNQSSDECSDQNFICFNEDGTVILLENAYKTKPTYGTSRTDLTSLNFLTYYLKTYCTKMRPLLLCGKEHDFFFVNWRGDPFTHKSYNRYISALFDKYFSLKLTTVDLRKAVVDHFLTLPESGDYSLRESFATLMKHSVRTQRRYYDERPLAVKKMKAIDLLSSAAARGIEADEVDILSDEDQEGYIEYLPNPGEFVALVAANSTRPQPEVFVARLLRLSEDHKTAHLADFNELEPGQFKLNAGKSYKEAVAALIYPIDVVYVHSNGVYELRTPKIDIHNQVKKQ